MKTEWFVEWETRESTTGDWQRQYVTVKAENWRDALELAEAKLKVKYETRYPLCVRPTGD